MTEPNNLNLLPCPFCGGPANIDREDNLFFKALFPFRVGCSLCNCAIKARYATSEEATRAWNHRNNKI